MCSLLRDANTHKRSTATAKEYYLLQQKNTIYYSKRILFTTAKEDYLLQQKRPDDIQAPTTVQVKRNEKKEKRDLTTCKGLLFTAKEYYLLQQKNTIYYSKRDLTTAKGLSPCK